MVAQPSMDVQSYVFYLPDGKSYLELYIGVLRSSVEQESQFLDLTYSILSDTVLQTANKLRIEIDSSSDKDFFILERVPIRSGHYSLTVMARTNAVGSQMARFQEKIDVLPLPETYGISDITMIGVLSKDTSDTNPYAKNGLVYEPLKYNFLNQKYDQMQAYVEIYPGQNGDSNYLLRYQVIYEAGAADTLRTRYRKREHRAVDPIIIRESIDSTWPSGPYTLVVDVYTMDREWQNAARTSFIVSNPAYRTSSDLVNQSSVSFTAKISDEELTYAIRSLAPRIDPNDITLLYNLANEGSHQDKASFVSKYWEQFAPLNPENGYRQYMKLAKAVDEKFYDGFGYGFESDRGYIYLKYGAPDQQVNVEDDPTAAPYEIWTYAEFPATRQNNVKFVFYSPSAQSYELLHSTARGELNDPQWLIKLYKNSPEDVIGNSIDARNVQDRLHRRAEILFYDN